MRERGRSRVVALGERAEAGCGPKMRAGRKMWVQREGRTRRQLGTDQSWYLREDGGMTLAGRGARASVIGRLWMVGGGKKEGDGRLRAL